MTSRSKSLPAREWRQVRIHPEECAEVQRLAARLGLAFPAALRQVLRAGLGRPSLVGSKGAKADSEGISGKVS
jgi:hypothetical protein